MTATVALLASFFTASAIADESITLTPNSADSRHFVQGSHTGPGPIVRLLGGDLVVSFTLSVGGPVELRLAGYDVDFANEVIIEGSDFSAFMSRGINNQHAPPETISLGSLPAGTYQYTISNNINPNWKWGVSDLLITAPTGVDSGEGDGDTFTLAQLSCSTGQVAKFNGESWVCAEDEISNTLPDGIEGPQGADGTAGIDGIDGVDGVDGMQGAPGVAGEQGLAGPVGPVGPVGPEGPPGPATDAEIIDDLRADILELYARIAVLEELLDDVFIPIDLEEQFDTDGDGLIDEIELSLGTDPDNSDSDGDGLDDGFEVEELGTDPLKIDSDDGGVDDSVELDLGSDPLNPDDDFLLIQIDDGF